VVVEDQQLTVETGKTQLPVQTQIDLTEFSKAGLTVELLLQAAEVG
jgi:hypothetical protein